MKKPASFTIYNASAGSGKTFTLVKEYLKLIINAPAEGYYRNLLAITFTNKAVAEMKQRIIAGLVAFSKEDVIENAPPMLLQIAKEIQIPIEEIHLRSKRILKHLLHHYAGFSVETIDRFNHQLIRTFARDLSLSSNFEVSLDTQLLLTQAVDQLLSKAGEDAEITKVILDFALEKTDEDKSWDISLDIAKAAKLLFEENEASHVQELKSKSLQDFIDFSKELRKQIKQCDVAIVAKAEAVLEKIKEASIPFEDFSRQTLPNHFLKIAQGNYDAYANKLLECLQTGGNALYKKATDPHVAAGIDTITPFLLQEYIAIKSLVFQQKLYVSALKNNVPLSVINLVSQEMEQIKEEKNILPISEFNAIIHKEIKNQPAPFIYERLGEKYQHYFIDEFQDTSRMQWENLIPLIDNALSQQDAQSNTGSLLLVGDAKQSIYRWRGGLPEQFMGLYRDDLPFAVQEKQIENLETNFRSCAEIIRFNNEFFSCIAQHLNNPIHANLYEIGNKQHTNAKEGGYVKLEQPIFGMRGLS